QIYENKENSKKQIILAATAIASKSKKEVIKDLIEAFSLANIPLEKVN
ncbi:2239_t:CDS:1, partial [Racocetra fulgida]